MPGQQIPGSRILTADQFIEQWETRKTYTHLQNPKHQDRLFFCVRFLGACKNKLDVGCALGHSTNWMDAFSPGGWTGLDFSGQAIAKAAGIFPRIPFIFTPDFKSLIEAAGKLSFDGVVCSEVIEHVMDDDEAVKALWEISGKILVVTTPAVRVGEPAHLRLYNREMLERLFRFIYPADLQIKQIGSFWYVICAK